MQKLPTPQADWMLQIPNKKFKRVLMAMNKPHLKHDLKPKTLTPKSKAIKIITIRHMYIAVDVFSKSYNGTYPFWAVKQKADALKMLKPFTIAEIMRLAKCLNKRPS